MISIGQLGAISKRASKILSAAENVERLHRCERLRKDIEVKALRDLVVLLKQEMLAGLEDLIHVLLQTTTNCTTFF